jgi:ABC-type branched-subunit amino acid transport system ATPase component
MFKIQNINKSCGEQKILDEVTFALKRIKVYAIVGGNVLEKTTLFNIIRVFIRPDSGEKPYIKP